MAAKTTIQQITDFGFRSEQFGTPPDWVTASTGYIARALAEAAAWTAAQLGKDGAAYDAMTGVANVYAATAEFCYARALLWKRRAAFIDSNAASSLENAIYLDRREFEAQATRAYECAAENIAMALSDGQQPAGTGAALAAAVSGPFVDGGGACTLP